MFQKLNRLITFIPMLLVWEYLFLFIIRYSDWYERNAKLLDSIDNYVVLFSIFHFLAYIEIYTKLQIVYFFCLFLAIQLQLVYYFIPESVYYFLYLLIIITPIIITII